MSKGLGWGQCRGSELLVPAQKAINGILHCRGIDEMIPQMPHPCVPIMFKVQWLQLSAIPPPKTPVCPKDTRRCHNHYDLQLGNHLWLILPPPFSKFLLKPAQEDQLGCCTLERVEVQERRRTESPLKSMRQFMANTPATSWGSPASFSRGKWQRRQLPSQP